MIDWLIIIASAHNSFYNLFLTTTDLRCFCATVCRFLALVHFVRSVLRTVSLQSHCK